MKGEAKVTDVGMQLEYFPLSIRDLPQPMAHGHHS